MFCKKCGTEIEEGQNFCPNCGAEIANQDEVCECGCCEKEKGSNTVAVVGFILAFLIPLAGFVCGICGLKKAKEGQGRKGLAIAAIVISVANWILNIVFTFAIIPLFAEDLDDLYQTTEFIKMLF